MPQQAGQLVLLAGREGGEDLPLGGQVVADDLVDEVAAPRR